MPTRLYLPATGAPDSSPAFDAGWDDVEDADRVALAAAKDGAAGFATKTGDEASTTNAIDVLIRQYVSPPLTAGTEFDSDTLRGQVRAQESGAGANAALQVVVRVVTADGTAVQAILLDFEGGSAPGSVAEVDTTLTNIAMPRTVPAALSNYTTVAGDRLVIEIGVRVFNTSGSNFTFTLDLGNPTGTDLPEDNSTTAQQVPWLEFSNTFTFASGAIEEPVGQATETDTALGMAAQKLRAVGQTAETDSALAATSAKARPVGAATETATALPLAARRTITIGIATTTDSALPVAAAKRATIGHATETGEALPAATPGEITEQVGLATDTSTALPITAAKALAVGQAAEASTAHPIGRLHTAVVGLTAETSTAHPATAGKRRATGLATETDSALPISAGGTTPAVWRAAGARARSDRIEVA